MPDPGALDRLVAEELVVRVGERVRTTRRWQAAMARAALRLLRDGAPANDLRLPIAVALAELHPELPDEALAELVHAMLPVEAAELAPGAAAPPAVPDVG
ncbi:MAG TPA: hypothetical protein VM753_23190 [Anaeromyxobacter sp.]|nr:hypothetical protein [Anaeromyxobacter sp.]